MCKGGKIIKSENKIPLIVIAGPTASGKTALAVEIAKKYNGEVVSADSMQIYKGLDIATAKPTPEEMQGIVHHLVDFLPPDTPFSVADYVKLAGECISDIISRGKQPVLCGGTGLYISSLTDNVKFDDTGSDPEIRSKLEKEAEKYGNDYLWNKLNEVDPETAAKVHKNNLCRVIRGLEVYELTGEKLSVHKINSRLEESPYKCCKICLTAENRQFLYDRINRRVDKMVESGMVEECRDFYQKVNPATVSQAIGYKELIPYFKGFLTLDECIEKIKQETRHYAKRQLTWFRKIDDMTPVMIDKLNTLNDITNAAACIIDNTLKKTW